jgi:hypothetical protein
MNLIDVTTEFKTDEQCLVELCTLVLGSRFTGDLGDVVIAAGGGSALCRQASAGLRGKP